MEGLITGTTPPRSSITIHYSEKDAIKYCYTVMIFDQSILTTSTSHPDVVTDWIVAVKRNTDLRYVGFEIEYDITSNRIGTLQFCIGNQCLVFQLDRNSPLPPSLDLFLGDKNNTFVGTNTNSKIKLLKVLFQYKAVVKKENAIDMCDIFPFLGDVKQTELDLIPLGKMATRWDRLPVGLTAEQVHYACLDAFLNLHIWKPLSNLRLHFPISDKTSITPYPKVDGAIKKCYDVVVFGETISTTVTKHPDAVKEWIDAVSTLHLGFEVEYDHTHRLGTLQLCDGPRCLVFQLTDKSPLPPFFGQFLGDRNRSFVGNHHIEHNVKLLKKQFGFSGEVNCMAGESSMESIVWKHSKLGSIELEEKETEWTRPSELSDKQVHYACVDVFINYQVARNLGKIPWEDKSFMS